jgi:Rap1a immunity proteins
MHWVLGLLAIAVSVSSAAAQQDYNSANFMLPHCQRSLSGQPGAMFESVCAGSITTFVFVGRDLRICPDHRVTPEQMIRVVITYIEVRPERLHEDWRELALEALRDAWPCR